MQKLSQFYETASRYEMKHKIRNALCKRLEKYNVARYWPKLMWMNNNQRVKIFGAITNNITIERDEMRFLSK